MDVNPATSTLTAVRDGETFHFCSAGCQAKFEANPKQYAGHDHTAAAAAEVPPGAEVAEYTCPMHPDIRQAGPGSCPVLILAMGGDLFPAIRDLIAPRTSAWVQLVLATPVVTGDR